VADAIVLVVAADDGISQQTKECIGIAESMNKPVIVVLNKIDLIPEDRYHTIRE
jgi:GTPase